MLPMKISRERLALLKTELRNIAPAVGSSHANEALAFAMGFKTYASLLASMSEKQSSHLDVSFDLDRLIERLGTLGYLFTKPKIEGIVRAVRTVFEDDTMSGIREMASRHANDNG